MPWTAADAERHVKGLSLRQRRIWARVANERLAACLSDGGKREACEASAIRQANAVAKEVSESMEISEAATIKAKLQGFMRQADRLLADRALPKKVREQIAGIRKDLKRTWDELGGEDDSGDAKGEGGKAAGAEESARTFADEALRVIDTAASFGRRQDLVRKALEARYPAPEDKPWKTAHVRELFPDHVIFGLDAEGAEGYSLQKSAYSIDETGSEPRVSLGEPKAVVQVYAEVDEAGGGRAREAEDWETAGGEFVPLVEQAVGRDGCVTVKVIEPGWGTSGFYPSDVLARDGPKVFTRGTQMFWDHPTPGEEAERPERSLRDLAGVLAEDARYRDDGPKGPGLYARARVFKGYQDAVNDMAGDIGVSIRASGKAAYGEAEGREGKVIEAITGRKSVDFVTRAGAGGQVVQLFESHRGRTDPLSVEAVDLQQFKRIRPDLIEALRAEINAAVHGEKNQHKEALRVSEERVKALEAENARLREAVLLRDARTVADQALSESKLPEVTRKRLAERLITAPVTVQEGERKGQLDVEAFKNKVKEAVKAELDYLQEAVGGAGRIRGMGPSGGGEGPTDEQVEKDLKESFQSIGLSESAAARAAKGRR